MLMVPNRRWTLMREVPFTEGTSLMSAYFSRMEGEAGFWRRDVAPFKAHVFERWHVHV